jgi:tetratricopeptide (TPR) repeat protein
MKRSAYLVAITAFLLAPGAMAADNSALALFTVGKYAAAEKAGVAAGDAQGYAIATRSVLADELMHTPCLECLQRAEAYARKAIAADPKYPEGHIYLAVTFGYEARIIGIIEARFKGYAEESRQNLDDVLAVEPNNAWALAGLGGWNIEIVRTAGDTLARWTYSASVKTGREYFAKAFAVDPNNLVLRYQYALVLGAYDPETYRKEIEETLTRAAAGTPHSEFDKFEQARARALLEAIKAPDLANFSQMVHHDQGYP